MRVCRYVCCVVTGASQQSKSINECLGPPSAQQSPAMRTQPPSQNVVVEFERSVCNYFEREGRRMPSRMADAFVRLLNAL